MWASRHHRPTGSRGYPGGGCKGATPLCPPEAWPVGHRRKEYVSKRGRRVACPLTNPQELQSQRCGLRESSSLVPQSGHPLLTTVPHGSASGGKGSPLDPGCRGTAGCARVLRRPGRGSSRRDKPFCHTFTDDHPANAPRDRPRFPRKTHSCSSWRRSFDRAGPPVKPRQSGRGLWRSRERGPRLLTGMSGDLKGDRTRVSRSGPQPRTLGGGA